MKSGKECAPCFFRQVLSTVEKSTDDEKLQLAALKKAIEVVSELPVDGNPAINTYHVLK